MCLKSRRPDGGGEPILGRNNYRFIIRDGAEELMLNLAPRTLGTLAEQLLGKDTLVWFDGLDITEVVHKR